MDPVERTAASALAFVVDHFLLLPIGALVALARANTARESYFRFAYTLRFAVMLVHVGRFTPKPVGRLA